MIMVPWPIRRFRPFLRWAHGRRWVVRCVRCVHGFFKGLISGGRFRVRDGSFAPVIVWATLRGDRREGLVFRFSASSKELRLYVGYWVLPLQLPPTYYSQLLLRIPCYFKQLPMPLATPTVDPLFYLLRLVALFWNHRGWSSGRSVSLHSLIFSLLVEEGWELWHLRVARRQRAVVAMVGVVFFVVFFWVSALGAIGSGVVGRRGSRNLWLNCNISATAMAPFSKLPHFILSFRPVSSEGLEAELRPTSSWGCLIECFADV